MRSIALIATLALATFLSSCASTAPLGTPVTWPKQSFTTVKAYAYHCDAEPGRDFIQPSGRYHIGILKPGPVELTPDQVKVLLTAATVPQPKSWRTPCYVPHHTFVFFDANGKRVANLDICFTCNKYRAFPGGMVEYPDMHRLYALVQELGLPTGTGKYFYRDLYNQQGGQLR